MQSFRFDVDAKALSAGLADVMRASQKRATVAVLGGVLIEAATGRGITLTATDLEIRASITLQASSTVRGDVVVADPKALLALLKTLKGSVSFSTEGDTLTVETGAGARFSFTTIAAEDFPRAREFDGSGGQLETTSFLSVLEHVLPVASKDTSRPVLTAVCMDWRPDRLTAAATDSYRLAMDSMPVDGPASVGPVNVPAAALRELQRIAKRKGTPSSIGWTINAQAPHHVRFTVSAYTVSARCIDGQYPDWRELLPADHTVSWTVPASDLAAATSRVAATMPKKDLKPVRVAADDGAATLTVSATVVDGPGGSETVAAATGYPPMEIGFNPDFLGDALAFCGETARIRLISPLRPAVFLNGREASETFHLLMPVRLAD